MCPAALNIKDLTLAGDDSSRDSPKYRQLPPTGTVPTDLTPLSVELSIHKKRGNKRALPSSMSSGRRRDGEVVLVQGLLVVAEQVDRGHTQQSPPVFRTLGSIYCVLVRKSTGLFLETVSKDSHHIIVLNVDAMDFVHEPFASDCKFQLCCRQGEVGESGNDQRASSYTFTTSTKEEYTEWLNGICSQQASGTNRERKSSVGEPVPGSFVLERDQRNASSNAPSQDQQPQPSLGEFMCSMPPRIKHFILIRHGHYINAHMPQVSDSNQILSQMGRQQAKLTGKKLRTAHNRVPTRHDVAIYHSDMTRAVETASIIATDFETVSLNSSSLLREGWPGVPYSTHFTASDNSVFDAMQKRAQKDVKRMEKAFNWFFSDSGKPQEGNNHESYCILVCHANLIRFFLCRALGVDPATTWGHFEINHCGITRIDVRINQPIKVIAVNETGHLPHSLITSSEDHL